LGMGEAFVAIANTYAAPYWNPAGLAFTEGVQLGGTAGEPLNKRGARLLFGGAVLPLSPITLGINVSQVQGPGLGGMGESEQLILGGFAIRPIQDMALGVSVSAYQNELAGGAADQRISVDLGAMVRVLSLLTLGVTIRDLTHLEEDPLPPTGVLDRGMRGIRISVAMQALNDAAIFALQWDVEDRAARIGFELNPLQALPAFSGSFSIALRLGVLKPEQGEKSTILGFGLGLLFLHADIALLLRQRDVEAVVISGGMRF